MHFCNLVHFKAAKRVLRNVKGTLSYGVKFMKVNELKLIGYTDSDWAGSVEDMKSTSGYFTLRSSVFSWSSKKQETVAQPIAEAEYIAATAAISRTLWIRKLMSDLNLMQGEAIEIYCSNQFVVAIAKNFVFHCKTKHFKIKYHFVREVEQSKQSNEVKLVHCSSGGQLADILTKPLEKMKFERLRHDIGVRSIMAKEECCEVAIHAIANTDHTVASSSKSVNSSKVVSLAKMLAYPSCD